MISIITGSLSGLMAGLTPASGQLPNRKSVFDLIRLPAALSVPGDSVLGAAAAGAPMKVGRSLGLAASSISLYWAGMALNDYADRDVDRRERPGRPIPSGRVSPEFALRLSQGLTVLGVGMAAISGGKRSAMTASGLAGAIWTYDMVAKDSVAGPYVMGAARGLDVLLGASGAAGVGDIKRAVPAALTVAGHTAVLTTVSRNEVEGGNSAVVRRARIGTVAVVGAASVLALRGAGRRPCRLAVRGLGTAGLLVNFARPILAAQRSAEAVPSPHNMQKVVGKSMQGMIPLQSALINGHGRPVAAALVGALWPLSRRLRRAIT